jgi:hypothetical protein
MTDTGIRSYNAVGSVPLRRETSGQEDGEQATEGKRQPAWPHLSPAYPQVAQSLRLFAEQVMPHFT